VKVGNCVVLRAAPGVEGRIISIDGRRARIYWSSHFSQLVDLANLALAPRIHKPPHQTERTK
jgi:hypothetical protein